MTPYEGLEALRGLDRRLLALEGDLQTREETSVAVGIAVGPVAVGRTFDIPDGDETSRLDLELAEISAELERVARAVELDVIADSGEAPSRWSSDRAYDVIEGRTGMLRAEIRDAFDALAAAHPDLQIRPLTDESELDEDDVPMSWWQRSGAGRLFIFLPFIGIFGALFWNNYTRHREAFEAACSSPPPCEGDIATVQELDWFGDDHVVPPGYVVKRKSADCSRDVESYFDSEGGFRFRGSLDDPDEERRAKFIKKRADLYEEFELKNEPEPCTKYRRND